MADSESNAEKNAVQRGKRGSYDTWLSQPNPNSDAKMPRQTKHNWKDAQISDTCTSEIVNADSRISHGHDGSQASGSGKLTTSCSILNTSSTASTSSESGTAVPDDFVKNFFAEVEAATVSKKAADMGEIDEIESRSATTDMATESQTESVNDMDINVEDMDEVNTDRDFIIDNELITDDNLDVVLDDILRQSTHVVEMGDEPLELELEGTDDAHEVDQLTDSVDCDHSSSATDDEDVESREEEEDLESEDDDGEQETVSSATEDNDNDKPIYKGARINVGTHMLLIIAFVVRHGLSGSAMMDLLTLIEIHCATYNLCQTSLRLFNRYFENRDMPVEKHYFCANSKCGAYSGKEKKKKCDLCGKEQTESAAESSYFVVCPLAGVLKSFFKRDKFVGLLNHSATERMKQHPDHIEDVYDGKVYQERFADDGFFHGTSDSDKSTQIHISLQINTDGVALFKSSKSSVWPVFLVINELHPKLRYSREYRILAGMWFGQCKPRFTTFMQPFADMLNSLYSDGVQVELPTGEKKIVKAILLSAVFDSPARCLFQNLMQFNGKHGCAYCMQKGTTVKTSERGQVQTYPYETATTSITAESGHGPARTHEETLRHAEEADRTGDPVMGVKGTTPIMFVPLFDIIRCVAPDYMHGITIGVFKLMVELWFDVAHRCSKWSIRHRVKEVDERLISIRPPNFISRPPQSIQTQIKWWKASEYRSFLLFYAVPCLYGILPTPYFDHMLLLVNSVHILLSNSISREKLEHARRMLKLFVYQMKDLYHSRYYTWNVHSLLHYVSSVEDLGPLFILSCFWYEDFNGDLRNMFHGTRGVGMQVLTSIAISYKIPLLARRLKFGTSELALYKHMSSKSNFKQMSKGELISEAVHVVGVWGYLDEKFLPAITQKIGEVSEVKCFKRIFISGKLLHCKMYTRITKRSNYTITYNNNGNVCIGNIIVFIKCRRKCPNVTFCSENCICQYVLYEALIESLNKADVSLSERKPLSAFMTRNFIMPVVASGVIDVVPVSEIISQCVLMDVGLEELFVGMSPNFHEKD